MRLIDADELIEFLKKVTITDGITFETGFKQILTDIKNQPTVEPVRGEWQYTSTYGEYECSNCKSMMCLSDDANGHPNFCPNCGADMRKKVEE